MARQGAILDGNILNPNPPQEKLILVTAVWLIDHGDNGQLSTRSQALTQTQTSIYMSNMPTNLVPGFISPPTNDISLVTSKSCPQPAETFRAPRRSIRLACSPHRVQQLRTL